MTDRHINQVTPIPADRGAPGGPAGVDAMDWVLRASLVALTLAGIWFMIVAIKPLPAGDPQLSPAIPNLATLRDTGATIDERQDRLASLNASGNIFASDRQNWPVSLTRSDDSDELAPTDRGASQAPSVIASGNLGADPIDSIEIADNAPTAIMKRLEQIKLRGVYVVRNEPVAMIGKKTNAGSEPYRVGDTFDSGEWRLVAIDDISDRVILNRSGLNFELKLYDTGINAYAESQPRTSISATNTGGDIEIDFKSLDKVATELREAGLPRDQINELITLAQADQTPAPEPDKANKKDTDASPAVTVPVMPPGMVQLFRAMAEGSRTVAAPPPAPEPSDEAQADEPAEVTPDDQSDEKDKDS